MKTEREALFSKVERSARKLFPRYTVVAESDPSDSGSIGVGVYGVPRAQISAVRNAIYDLEEELFPHGECCLSAFVRDIEFTRKNCPQYLPASRAEAIDLGELCLQLSRQKRSGWVVVTPPNSVAVLRRYASEQMDFSFVTDSLSAECNAKWSPEESCPSSEVPVSDNNFDRAA